MAKKKKTLKQKILSEQRTQQGTSSFTTQSGNIVISSISGQTPTIQRPALSSLFTYTHLKIDLLKTTGITFAIVLIELVLHFLTKGV